MEPVKYRRGSEGGGLLLLPQSKHSVDGAATAEVAKQLQFCLF
jgi:hypothetical protein